MPQIFRHTVAPLILRLYRLVRFNNLDPARFAPAHDIEQLKIDCGMLVRRVRELEFMLQQKGVTFKPGDRRTSDAGLT
jgi:hypothetical protein